MAKGYQNYRGRHSAGARAAIVLLVIVLIAACASIFAQQYIVYADDGGIYLDLPFLGRVDLPAPPKPEPDPEEPAGPEDLWRHVERFMELGAEGVLALGSDADGADLPGWLDGPEKFAGLYQLLLERGLSQSQAEGILWRNALDFLKKAGENG